MFGGSEFGGTSFNGLLIVEVTAVVMGDPQVTPLVKGNPEVEAVNG